MHGMNTDPGAGLVIYHTICFTPRPTALLVIVSSNKHTCMYMSTYLIIDIYVAPDVLYGYYAILNDLDLLLPAKADLNCLVI